MGLFRHALLAAAACLVLMLAAGCDTADRQDSSATQSAQTTAADEGGDSAAAAPDEEPGTAETDGGEDMAGETAADAQAGEAEGEPADGDVHYYREVDVDIRLLKAEFNPDPDATMSVLRFLFEAGVAPGMEVDREVELTDIEELVSAELDLGHSRLEIFPVVSKPRLTDEGPLGEYSFRFDGMYRINLLLPDGTLCGVFAVNQRGELMTAPPEERPEGFGATSRMTRDQYGPRKYQVFRSVEKGEETEVLYTVYYTGAGFNTIEVVSPEQDIYEYRFPEGRLTVRKGDEKEDDRNLPKVRDPEKDYKDR